jgi:hypothetical protein
MTIDFADVLGINARRGWSTRKQRKQKAKGSVKKRDDKQSEMKTLENTVSLVRQEKGTTHAERGRQKQ